MPTTVVSFVVSAFHDSTLVTLICPAFYKAPYPSNPRFPKLTKILEEKSNLLHTMLLSLVSGILFYLPTGIINSFLIYDDAMTLKYLWPSFISYIISTLICYPILLGIHYKVSTICEFCLKTFFKFFLDSLLLFFVVISLFILT